MDDDPLLGASVLIVEDNALNRRLFIDILSTNWADATAHDLIAPACRDVEERSFDLILVNDFVSDGTCLDLLAAVRAQEVATPTLVMTTHHRVDQSAAWMAAGAAGWIEKPITVNHFLATIRDVIRAARDAAPT